MDVCKSPLVRLVAGEEMREAPDSPQGVLPQNRGGTEINRTVTFARGLLVTDLVIFSHHQVTRTTPELVHPHLSSTPHQREDVELKARPCWGGDSGPVGRTSGFESSTLHRSRGQVRELSVTAATKNNSNS
ncbi:hypothetical protein TNCV_3913351 [Trichonephila clavipes]|nr:hypothetical protein TNCV_3913351 [Trichonephila clavipes]